MKKTHPTQRTTQAATAIIATTTMAVTVIGSQTETITNATTHDARVRMTPPAIGLRDSGTVRASSVA